MKSRWIVSCALCCAIVCGYASAGAPQWQLLHDGDPLQGVASQMVHFEAGDELLLRVGDGYLAPRFWRLEEGDWARHLVPTAELPATVNHPVMAYDSRRERVVLFGGTARAGVSNETWEYDGTRWVERDDVGAPPARVFAAMAFDRQRGVIVLFGGSGANGLLDDLWEYDGTSWAEIVPTGLAPSPRMKHGMAYDALRQVVVMAFGETQQLPALNETWEYDGAQWTKAPPQLGTSPRSDAAVEYDPVRERVYTFGGVNAGPETRFWDGIAWQLVTVSEAPPARFGASMAFDTRQGRLVLFGGEDGSSTFSDTWAFDGASWTEIAPEDLPRGRRDAAMTFDRGVGRAILHGGWSCCRPAYYQDTWEWDGSTWLDVTEEILPGLRESHSLAYDPEAERSVLFGGWKNDADACVSETWLYDADRHEWTEDPGSAPSSRCAHRMVRSSAHGGGLVFGGHTTLGWKMNDTWLHAEGDWTELTPSNPPPARSNFAMASNVWDGTVVVYGGQPREGEMLSDTWVLDGLVWRRVDEGGPGARAESVLVFDEKRGRSVLVGGGYRDTHDELTWEFDGTSWLAVDTVYTPDMHRYEATAVWDPKREVVLLTGGRSWGLQGAYNDVWAYGWDSDGDLRVDGYDNCPDMANANQDNGDGDPAGDVCDCAPGDPGATELPFEVTALLVQGDTSTRLDWASLAGQAGSEVRYDVVGGRLTAPSSDPFADAECLASSLWETTYLDQRPAPSPGSSYWYLPRAKNVCGVGTFGSGRAALEGAAVCPE